jgi:hypothetical protein
MIIVVSHVQKSCKKFIVACIRVYLDAIDGILCEHVNNNALHVIDSRTYSRIV